MYRWLTVLLVFGIVVGCMGAGCQLLGPKSSVSPGKSDWFDRLAKELRADGTKVEIQETGGSTVSPGYQGEDAGEFDNEGGSVGGKGSEHGGASGAFSSIKGFGSSIYLIGAGLIIGAGLLGYFVSWKVGAIVGVGGIVGIAAILFIESYAWVIGGAALICLIVLGYAVYRVKRDGDNKKLTFSTIVAALESAGKEATDVVKAKIKELSKVNGNELIIKEEVNKAKSGK